MPQGIYPGNEKKQFCRRGHNTFLLGRNGRACRECQAIWRKNNPKKSAQLSLAAHYRRRKIIDKIKMQPCADCKIQYPPCVMDFDHISGVKAFNISKVTTYSLERVLEEIAKCEIVCSNCHRLRTYTRLKNIKETQNV
jgi:hypothetical protein